MKPTLLLKQIMLEEVHCTLSQRGWIEMAGSRKVWMDIHLLTPFLFLSFHQCAIFVYLSFTINTI
jgi:hypothetical protein